MEDNELLPTRLSPLVRTGPMPAPASRSAAAGGAHPAKAKPDPRPMRIAFFAGGLAAVSALLTAIVVPAKPAVVTTISDAQQQQSTVSATGTPISVQQPIQYIQLKPGQTAPPGAMVVNPSGPLPTSVVITVPAPAQKAAAQKPIIIRTTQSGKVIP